MNDIVIAKLNLAGMLFDSLGGLYLAYDILGGEKGPLRLITRFISYSILLFFLYYMFFGFKFAILASIGIGFIVSLQFYLYNRFENFAKKWIYLIFVATTLVFSVALFIRYNFNFAKWFVIINVFFITIFFKYFASIRDLYRQIYLEDIFSRNKKFSLNNYYPALLRGFLIGVSALLSAYISFGTISSLIIGVRLGIITSLSGIIVTTFVPYIEKGIDKLPDRTLGVFGIILFVVGFILQSLQYVFVLWHLD